MVQMHLAELDQQIATARAYPRQSISRITSEIETMAGESEDTAQECIYALKRDGKEIIGPTVRFAEIVSCTWGNAEYGSRIIDEGKEFVTAQASFRDLEKNIRIVVETKRRIVGSNGNRYGIDMIGVTSNAAMSIALRNAILKGVPRAVWGPAYAKCLAMIKGTFETIERRRSFALEAYKKMGVDQALVLSLLEVEKVGDIDPEHMLLLRGTLQAIKDGDTTVQAVFGAVARNNGGAAKADTEGHLKRGRENGQSSKASEAEQGGAQGNGAGGKPEGGNAGNGAGAGQSADGGSANETQGGADGDRGGSGSDRAANDGGNAPGDGGSSAESQGGPEGGAGGGSADGGAVPDAASVAPVEVQEAYRPFLEQGWTDAERAKLTNLAVALGGAATAVQVTKVQSEFQPVFETGSSELESAFTKMVGVATKTVRAKKSAASEKL